METKVKKQTRRQAQPQETVAEQKPKSKTTLFWEKYPEGVLKIVDRRAVLR